MAIQKRFGRRGTCFLDLSERCAGQEQQAYQGQALSLQSAHWQPLHHPPRGRGAPSSQEVGSAKAFPSVLARTRQYDPERGVNTEINVIMADRLKAPALIFKPDAIDAMELCAAVKSSSTNEELLANAKQAWPSMSIKAVTTHAFYSKEVRTRVG